MMPIYRGMKRWLIALLILLGLVIAIAVPASAAPKAELWERWTAHDPESTITVDHRAFGRFIGKHVSLHSSGHNPVAYSMVSDNEKANLEAYIDELAHIPVSRLNRQEQLPYWINLYNAVTVKVVLDHYPVDSIRDIDISPGIFADGPWGAELVTVEGVALTLDDIEHRILRPIWKDPRIHYAVNCASLGCPNLQHVPFTAANADLLLTIAAKAYVNHWRGVEVDGDDRIILSKLYDWYADDFGEGEAGVMAHIRRYAKPELVERMERAGGGIDGYAYDWTLNGLRNVIR